MWRSFLGVPAGGANGLGRADCRGRDGGSGENHEVGREGGRDVFENPLT